MKSVTAIKCRQKSKENNMNKLSLYLTTFPDRYHHKFREYWQNFQIMYIHT